MLKYSSSFSWAGLRTQIGGKQWLQYSMFTLRASAHRRGRMVEKPDQCPYETLKCLWEAFLSSLRDCFKPCTNFYSSWLLWVHSHSCRSLIISGSLFPAWISFTVSVWPVLCWAGTCRVTWGASAGLEMGMGYFFWIEWAPKIQTSFQIPFNTVECICLLQRAK